MSNRARIPSFSPLSLLDRLIATVELSDTQHTKVKQSYEAVAKALKNSKTLQSLILSLDIKPQGSVRAGTTIKPQGQHEFDLDMLCVILLRNPHVQPVALLKLIWDALGENETYRSMRRPKDRCVRLDYAGDFHLDITPARPVDPPPLVWVPDKSAFWSSSNPIGLCDDWFLKIAELLPSTLRTFSATNEAKVANSSVTIEPLPKNGAFEKRPLQRLVQLAKHDRDRHFDASSNFRPSSVLLTTLVAKAYAVAISEAHGSLSSFVVAVLQRIPVFITILNNVHLPRYVVDNPMNTGENFAEAWTERHYQAFMTWHSQLVTRCHNLLFTPVTGIDPAVKLLEANFPSAKELAIGNQLGREVRSLHDQGALIVRTAAAPLTFAAVPQTIYFGTPY